MSDLTPVMVESKLRSIVTELTRAQQNLSAERDVEVEAELAWKAAYRKAMFAAPAVTRGGVTTAERDAHVEEACAGEYRVFRLAEARRKAAEDHLRVTRDQGVLCASLAKSVDTAYRMAGVS